MYVHKLKESSSIIIVAFPIIHAYSAYSSKYEAYELYNYTSIVTLIIAKVRISDDYAPLLIHVLC